MPGSPNREDERAQADVDAIRELLPDDVPAAFLALFAGRPSPVEARHGRAAGVGRPTSRRWLNARPPASSADRRPRAVFEALFLEGKLGMLFGPAGGGKTMFAAATSVGTVGRRRLHGAADRRRRNCRPTPPRAHRPSQASVLRALNPRTTNTSRSS